MTDSPTPTVGANREALFALVGLVRAELRRRGEPLAADWVDQAVEDLARGELPGYYYAPDDPPGGLGFLSPAGGRAYGHVHVEPGPRGPERAQRLVEALCADLAPAVQRADFGLSGLSSTEEGFLTRNLVARGGEVIARQALERPLAPGDGNSEVTAPGGTHHAKTEVVDLESLVDLDRRAFADTPDASLIAETPEEHRRVLREIFGGRLGTFLPEASTVLLDDAGRPVAAVLAAEETPHRAVLHDLVVDPARTRRGLGGYLLRWVFRALWARGYSMVGLWVTETNRPARALYDLNGFVLRTTATIYRWVRPSPTVAAAHPQTSR